MGHSPVKSLVWFGSFVAWQVGYFLLLACLFIYLSGSCYYFNFRSWFIEVRSSVNWLSFSSIFLDFISFYWILRNLFIFRSFQGSLGWISGIPGTAPSGPVRSSDDLPGFGTGETHLFILFLVHLGLAPPSSAYYRSIGSIWHSSHFIPPDWFSPIVLLAEGMTCFIWSWLTDL